MYRVNGMTPRMLFESAGAAGAAEQIRCWRNKWTNELFADNGLNELTLCHILVHTLTIFSWFHLNGATDFSFSEFTICYGCSYFHSSQSQHQWHSNDRKWHKWMNKNNKQFLNELHSSVFIIITIDNRVNGVTTRCFIGYILFNFISFHSTYKIEKKKKKFISSNIFKYRSQPPK